MVEMMVALLIIAIVSAASIAFFVDNIQGVNNQRQHQEAVYLADQQMETVQSLPVAKLVTGRTQTEVTALYSSAGRDRDEHRRPGRHHQPGELRRDGDLRPGTRSCR